MSEDYALTYGEVLRELRTYHGYKQKDLSNYLNITSQAYSNYETSKRTPDIETMRKLADYYGISVDKLISYRYTRQLEDCSNYGATLYRAVDDSGITIPMTAKQAKMVAEILSLPSEQQESCERFAKFLKKPKT